jgi:hypothetical protein
MSGVARKGILPDQRATSLFKFAGLLSRIGCTSEQFFPGVSLIETFDLEYTTKPVDYNL